ncbi:phage integrase family protein [Desulfosporosinus orientis DSM 765]|uniref:Phage integrase family protein n=1 Tax=Desulfosporosinus orientis (strain ATCC 19365 / DSM 765 / NCIMB 8382 / VKM B-1628 / Singapore I) TaxID=768706 RepID=G7W5H5_DESOD|nr:tyrosine-type recombinase/integrase [Desulfosporosinus orientis]AET66622.1 phage integrase family protein [Desulfosporosinus orientis DSM 765]
MPVFDKWYVAQNRRNHSTAYKSDDYVPFDFTRVKDHTMRKELKEWVFLSDKSLKTLKNMVNCVFLFFEFVEGDEIKKFRSNIVSISDYINEKNNFIINESNVMVFRQFGKQSFDSEETLNSYISSIRSFVKYIDSKHIYPISSGIYDFLTVKTSKGLSGKKIEDEDLRKMVLAFKDNMIKGNYIDKLFWIFMHLMLTTNFRPNDICSLKINCIADAMKTGDKVLQSKDKSIKLKTKTSRGKEIDVNPSEYTIRAINEAILVTDFIRKSGKKNQLGDYIFIQKDPHGNTAGINYDLFYRKFKQITGGLELKGGPYTVNNCRHTYMTKLFEEAVKNGNVYKSIIATGHRDYATTIKHYIKPEISDYLEAFYGVTLGNITLKGEIVANLEDSMEDLPKDIREITVKSGCGFCKGNITIRCIDCLLCSNFIVTIDRIPYFENSIEEINLKIQNQSILHEKEHLLSIKKLYVSYLAELVTLKENEEAEI